MKVKARMAGEPRSDFGMLVSRVVVGDQVQFKIGRHISIEMFQKAQEFLVAMARLALGDDPAVDDVQCREERGSAVTIVIVSHSLDITEPHWQHWLGALQGLHLALLIHAQYQRVVRRIKIKPNDVADLFDEERVGGELKALAPMWLQAEQREVARDRALGDASMRRHAAHAPVGGDGGLAVQYLAQQARYLFVAMAARSARTKFRVQPGDAALLITLAPQTDHRSTNPAAPGDLSVGGASGR